MFSNETTDNIFKIPDPENWACRITSLSDGHKLMNMEVSQIKGAEIFYLHFRKVIYFSGPTYWVGVNFRLATVAEFEIFSTTTYKSDVGFDQYCLFICSGVSHQIQLLANAGGSIDSKGNDLVMVPSPG